MLILWLKVRSTIFTPVMSGSEKRDRSPSPAPSPSPSQPRPTEHFTLRSLLEPRASDRFSRGGIADIEIENAELMQRLSAMQAGLVAHQSLAKRLSDLGTPASEMPKSLQEAIGRALHLGIITDGERKWLMHINAQANTAKHQVLWPF